MVGGLVNEWVDGGVNGWVVGSLVIEWVVGRLVNR